ncbi:MAG: hypothetical protein ACRC0S_01970 [Fusobacteriaceae bacterium]
MKKLYIYNIKNLEVIAEPAITSYKEFKDGPEFFYPDWDKNLHLASEINFINPILLNNEIREKTREELIILDDKIELLVPGEYLENGEIILVKAPEELFIKKWILEKKKWEEGATKEDIDREVSKLIDTFISLSEKKEKLKSYGFGINEIETDLAENIMRRNYLINLN